MNRIIAASRYLALIGVVFGLLAAVAAFAHTDYMAVALVQIMDAFLIAAGLLIFALGLHELFIGELALPPWLVIRDLDALKAKIAGVVILVMAVAFLERLETHENPAEILYSGIAVALVSAALVFLSRGGAAKH